MSKKNSDAEKYFSEIYNRRVRKEYFKVDRLIWYRAQEEHDRPRFHLAYRRDVVDNNQVVSIIYVDCATKRVLNKEALFDTKAFGRRVSKTDKESGKTYHSFILSDTRLVTLGALTEFVEDHTTQKSYEAERVARKAMKKAGLTGYPLTLLDVSSNGNSCKINGFDQDLATGSVHEKIKKNATKIAVGDSLSYAIESLVTDTEKNYSELCLSGNFVLQIENELNANIDRTCERIDPELRIDWDTKKPADIIFEARANYCKDVANNTCDHVQYKN